MSDALVDLTAAAGLPVRLDPRTGVLHFDADATSDEPGARRLGDMRDVLREPAAQGRDLLYHLYRAVRRSPDEPLLTAAGLRYDLTVTLPGMLGDEYAKTTGHYHPADSDGVSFPEVYEVVHGRAAFVLQRVDDVTADRPRIEAVWVQLCAAGERILIPPECGHVTVNIGAEPLVVADLISLRCGHIYGTFKALRGAAYHVLADPDAADGLRLERNPAYVEVPEATVARGSRWQPFLDDSRPVYAHCRAQPGDFSFLDRPAAAADPLLALWPGTARQASE
jgi:glucose-6-phosphate isomerase, archaeal